MNARKWGSDPRAYATAFCAKAKIASPFIPFSSEALITNSSGDSSVYWGEYFGTMGKSPAKSLQKAPKLGGFPIRSHTSMTPGNFFAR